MVWAWARSAATLTAVLTLSAPTAGWAQDKAIAIELNDASNVDGACRLVFVAVNKSGVLLDKTSYDVVTFDAAGKVGKSLTFQFGRLPVGKTKVVQFDLPGQACDTISRLLVNDVSECSVDGKASDVCIDALATTTRTKIEFLL
ncbi:hypothetical protein ABMA59_11250 [Mesorhizobium sp. CN2-181]